MPGPARVPTETPLDPIPTPVRAVIDLYQQELAGLTFPGLDAKVLEGAEKTVRDRTRALEKARAALEAARADLEGAQNGLLAHARKGLAYAQVFAEADPSLSETIAAIKLPSTPTKRAAKGAAKTARKKAKKDATDDAELPLDGKTSPASEAKTKQETDLGEQASAKETAKKDAAKKDVVKKEALKKDAVKKAKESNTMAARAPIIEPAIEYDEDESPPLLEEVSI